MKMLAVKEFRFEAAHRLPTHKGDCRYIHGHSYKVEVGLQDSEDNPRLKNGMVMDFSDIKTVMKSILDQWDHALILAINDPILAVMPLLSQYSKTLLFPDEPTAENMAEYIAERLISSGRSVAFVRVWETSTAYAEWRA